ncbi:MAG: Gfo/Idh/MocA family oxidoreductase [Planctomycetota bacterium]
MKRFKNRQDIRVGVVGYGGAFNMGRAHLREMKRAGMTPTAVCEIDPDRLAVAHKDFPGIETYPSLSAMLKQSDVDLVTHITPHHLHYPLAAQCLRAGKSVITEKPFVLTTAQADRLIKLAKEKRLLVSTYHNRHWDGWILRARKQIVERNAIGDAFRAEAHFGSYRMPGDWWRTSKSMSGGVLYDWGCHLLEYILQVIPDPIVEVSGYAKNGYWASQAPKDFRWRNDMNEDEATAVIRFAGGQVATLRVSSLADPNQPPLAFYGTKGSYSVNRFHAPKTENKAWTLRKADRKGVLQETHGKEPASKGHLFYDNIAGHMTGQEKLVITPEWARRPIHILELAGKSAKAGKAMRSKLD